MTNSAPVMVIDDKMLGHHHHYLDLLFEALHAVGVPVVYVTTSAIAESEAAAEWASRYPQFQIDRLQGAGWGDGRRPSSRDFAQLREVVDRHQPRHIYLMMLEGWILLLGMEHLLRRGEVFRAPWSAIFVTAPYNPRDFGGETTSVPKTYERLKDAVRRLVLSRVLSDPNLVTVHMVDEFALQFYDRTMRHKKFQRLADPVHEIYFDLTYDQQTERQKLGIDGSSYVYIGYGFQNPKKGTPLLIKAFAELSEDEKYDRAQLIVAGVHADPGIGEVLAEPPVEALVKCGRIRVDNRVVTDAEMLQYFRVADCVCVPYTDAIGTSGVLLHGLIQQKQIVSTRENWMGLILRREGVGMLCQSGSGSSLFEALREAFGSRPSYVFSEREAHRSHQFQKTLLGMLESEAGSDAGAQP